MADRFMTGFHEGAVSRQEKGAEIISLTIQGLPLNFRRVRCVFQRTRRSAGGGRQKERRTLLPSKPESHSQDRTTGDDVVPEQFAAAACFVVHPQRSVAKR